MLFVGVLLRNVLTLLNWHEGERSGGLPARQRQPVALPGHGLMSLKLWDLASLALPIFVLLAAQTVAMALYAVFVTFRVMGSNYDAAVLAAGHCGFGLGATPRRLPTCRPSPSASARPTWRSWWNAHGGGLLHRHHQRRGDQAVPGSAFL